MKSKKGINLILAIIAVILGWTIFKHFDFETFKFADPYLDVLYLVVFIILVWLIIKDYRKRPQ